MQGNPSGEERHCRWSATMTAAASSWGLQSRAFVGSASVLIRDLHPETSRKRSPSGEPDQKNVERLIDLFVLDKCRRFEHANRIPVLLSDTVLRRVLARNHLNIEELHNERPPAINLDEGTSLTYLRGRHRLAAAEQFLDPDDQRWGVNLYRSHGQYRARYFSLTSILTWTSQISQKMYAETCENTTTIHRKLTMDSFFATFAITRKRVTKSRPQYGARNGRIILANFGTFANYKTVTISVPWQVDSTGICHIQVSGKG
jgi:hypothetical protein